MGGQNGLSLPSISRPSGTLIEISRADRRVEVQERGRNRGGVLHLILRSWELRKCTGNRNGPITQLATFWPAEKPGDKDRFLRTVMQVAMHEHASFQLRQVCRPPKPNLHPRRWLGGSPGQLQELAETLISRYDSPTFGRRCQRYGSRSRVAASRNWVHRGREASSSGLSLRPCEIFCSIRASTFAVTALS